jgi:pimeloyl-ACP methyl ester carboxylesterase
LKTVAGSYGPVHAVVGHSLGAAATAFALEHGVGAERVVFIGAAADPVRWIHRFSQHFGITPPVMAAMRARSERHLGVSWSDLDVLGYAGRQTAPLLVVHDRGDREVAWAEGAAIAEAWPGAELATTTGLGHQRLLRDPGVVARVVSFVAQQSEAAPARPGGGSEALERYLFERASRA